MTHFRSSLRPQCWANSRLISLPSRSCPRSSLHIIIRPLISPCPHHVKPPSLHLFSPSGQGHRQTISFSTYHVNLRFASSSRAQPQTNRSAGRTIAFWLFSLSAAGFLTWQVTNRLLRRPMLNTTTFVPYTVVSHEQVSPTAFILTAKPSDRLPASCPLRILHYLSPLLPTYHTDAALVDETWRAGATWSVEVKQPQLQVARDYTPLPPPVAEWDGRAKGEGEHESEDGPELRFLIRRMDGGEVSNYLARLKVGDQVELRGPHYGFDVRRRLGDRDRVVFLAGGTGIAPALQVVKAVLEGGKRHGQEYNEAPKVDILWANRQRADCVGCPGVRDLNGELAAGHNVPVLEQLAQIQRKYPGRITVRCTVDEESSFVQIGALAELVTSAVRRTETGQDLSDCWLHSQAAVAGLPAADIDAEKKGNQDIVKCNCKRGRNLLFVSGPDGFVAHFAGAKRWANGMELQGPVGGILGKLKAKYPDTMRDWLVLKL